MLQGDDEPEIPIDGTELSHYRQRALLQSQPVRRTPLLHNFLHMLSSRSSGIQVGEQSTVQDSATPAPSRLDWKELDLAGSRTFCVNNPKFLPPREFTLIKEEV